mgnify:CR=1 FL=1
MACCQGLFVNDGLLDLRGICTKFQVWLDTIGYNGINLKDLQPQSGIYKEKIEKLECLAAWHGLGTHGGGGGKLNMIKMINAGPYRGGPCEFGHRVPGPVPRPVPDSFT